MSNEQEWEAEPEEVFEYPIDGTLDLHTFAPQEVQDLVPEYLDACMKKGISQVRIVHGKGKGVLRRMVHSALEEHPRVVRYRHEAEAGSWGATVVTLRLSK
jgi:DNA-nicking Smr family endonuclease